MDTVGNSKNFVSAHSIVGVNILEGPIGASMPFLFLEDGELSLPALAWARQRMRNETLSSVTLLKDIEAIGRVYDYYTWRHGGEELTVDEFRLLLKYFYEDRLYGLPELGWKAVGKSTAKADERAVKQFSRWCAENYGFVDINPEQERSTAGPTSKELHMSAIKEQNRKNWDLLFHLRSVSNPRGLFKDRGTFKAETRNTSLKKGYKFFPPEKAWALVNNATCYRDQMCFLLMFFAATRISEPLHLFATDISLTSDGSARVMLAHPQFGSYSWPGVDKKKRHGNRTEFLRERYGLGPRNLLGARNPMRSGWKGMAFSSGKTQEGEAIWLDERAGYVFAKAHIEYMRTVRSKVPDSHPYYFVNQVGDADQYGAPLKLSNLDKSFYRAARRIGLESGTPGVTPHGARHFAGWYGANVLKLRLELMQRILRHAQPSSTETYYHLTDEHVRSELQNHYEKNVLELPATNLLRVG